MPAALHTREHHYSPSTGQSQYWEWSVVTGWQPADKWDAGEWPLGTYRYVTWPGAIPAPLTDGAPPRVAH